MPKPSPDDPSPSLSDTEEAHVQAGIAADPDNPEWTEADFARARPFGASWPTFAARMSQARAQRKVLVTVRLDPETLAAFEATGPGWQGRMDAILEGAARKLREA